MVTNHFLDPKTRTVALIDPVKRGTGKGFITTLNRPRMGFASSEFRKNAASIFERSRERMRSTGSPSRQGLREVQLLQEPEKCLRGLFEGTKGPSIHRPWVEGVLLAAFLATVAPGAAVSGAAKLGANLKI